MRNVLITGGAGFIGSHVLERLYKDMPDSRFVVLDKMTYAADFENIAHILDHRRVHLVVGDICDLELCRRLLSGVDMLVHLAAESHVDNSFGDSLLFTKSNTLGTHTLLEAARENNVSRIIHVSTDEVYGEVLEGEADESTELHPSNPYSASKASAEMVVKSYLRSFNMPIVIVRANNVFGVRQFPEKLIPRCCVNLILGEKMPVHGNGLYRRRFLAAEDLADALKLLIDKGEVGEAYNIGSNEEYTNLEVIAMVCAQFGVRAEDVIEFVSNRPFNDQRYSISTAKIERLGWRRERSLSNEIGRIVEWYKANIDRYAPVSGGAVKETVPTAR